MIQGVILIDVWQTTEPEINEWYSTVVDKIYTLCKEPYFVNACYNNCWDYSENGYTIPDLSQYNLLRLYHKLDHQGQTPAVIESPNKDIPYSVMNHCRGLNKTAECFKKLFSKNNSIFLTESTDFAFHCKHYLQNTINHWLVVGKSWHMCLHYRHMGFNHLKTLDSNNQNFYIDPELCLDENNQPITEQHIQNDTLNWSSVSDNLWKLHQ